MDYPCRIQEHHQLLPYLVHRRHRNQKHCLHPTENADTYPKQFDLFMDISPTSRLLPGKYHFGGFVQLATYSD